MSPILESIEGMTLGSIDTSLRILAEAQPDLATRVAADIYVRMAVRNGCDAEMCEITAGDAVRAGRIFAEAFEKERS